MPRRQRRGELLVEVARAAAGEAVDELAHEPADLGLELLDLAGHEVRVEQAAVRVCCGGSTSSGISGCSPRSRLSADVKYSGWRIAQNTSS